VHCLARPSVQGFAPTRGSASYSSRVERPNGIAASGEVEGRAVAAVRRALRGSSGGPPLAGLSEVACPLDKALTTTPRSGHPPDPPLERVVLGWRPRGPGGTT
jgi:hypothetical protein